ncbi:MAG TPA: TolC family protein, partial [Fibrobacteria bacterium]|nr:TolC family protein [Fibrobacteria bacterium]
SAMAFSRERVRLTQGKYGLGSASKLELLQARLDLNADSSARLRQETSLAAARRGLNRLLARPESAPLAVADSLALSEVPSREALLARALEKSPAYLQTAEGRRLAEVVRREYLGRLAPKVDLTAGYNWGRTEAESGLLREGENTGWTYGANVRFNLFDGGVARTDLRNARLSVESATLREQEARARVETDVADAWTAWRASLDIVSLETSNLELARQNASIALERLRLGTIVSLELRAAQENFLEAESRLVAARYESKRAETDLLRLAGLLVPSASAP